MKQGLAMPPITYQVFSTFNIEMDIERNAWGLFLKIFIGMYIAFLISVISFTPHPSELEPRFGLPVGGLFAAVGNKYIIDSLLPESSTIHTCRHFACIHVLRGVCNLVGVGDLLEVTRQRTRRKSYKNQSLWIAFRGDLLHIGKSGCNRSGVEINRIQKS